MGEMRTLHVVWKCTGEEGAYLCLWAGFPIQYTGAGSCLLGGWANGQHMCSSRSTCSPAVRCVLCGIGHPTPRRMCGFAVSLFYTDSFPIVYVATPISEDNAFVRSRFRWLVLDASRPEITTPLKGLCTTNPPETWTATQP